jgi:hypothetical protein
MQAPPVVDISQACLATATTVGTAAVAMPTRHAAPLRAGGALEVVAAERKSRAMEVAADVAVVVGSVAKAVVGAATDLAAAVALGMLRRLIR